MVDAARLTVWVKSVEIWQLNFWIWILQTEENYVKVHFIRIDFYFLAFRLMPVSQFSLPSFSDIAILRGSILELETSARSVTIDIFNLLRRRMFCLRICTGRMWRSEKWLIVIVTNFAPLSCEGKLFRENS